MFGYDDHVSMFNESGGRVLVGIGLSEIDEFLEKAESARIPARKIGESGGSVVQFGEAEPMPVASLETAARRQLRDALGRGTVNS